MAQRYERQTLFNAVSGSDGRAETAAQLAGVLSEFSQRTGKYAQELQAKRGAEAGAQVGLDGAPKLKSSYTAYGAAYNNAALRNYTITSYADIEQNMARLEQEAKGDPAAFQTLAKGYQKETLKNAVPEARGQVAELFTRRFAEGMSKVTNEAIANQKATNRTTLSQGVKVLSDSIARKMRSGDPELMAEAQEEETQLILMVDGAVNSADLAEHEALDVKDELYRSTIPVATVEGMIDRDPYAALKELQDQRTKSLAVSSLHDEDRQKLTAQAQAEIARREAAARAGLVDRRNELNADIQDAFAAKQMNVPAKLPSKARFLEVYGEDGEQRYRAASQQWIAYDMAAAASLMAPADAQRYLSQLKPATQAGAADAKEALDMAVGLYAQRRKAIEDDPVGMLTQSDPELMKARQALASGSPDAQAAYFRKLESVQEAIGIAEPKLLSDAERREVALAFEFDPENPRARVESLARLKAQYGERYVDVMREVAPKLEGQSRVMIDMDPEQAIRLDAALAQKPELDKLVKGTDASDINAELDNQLEDLAVTLADNVDAETRLAEIRESAELLAKAYVMRGESPANAAKKAAAAVINDQYKFVGTMRIPSSLDADAVERGANIAQNTLAKSGEFAITALGNSSKEAAQGDMRALVKNKGYWVTNEKGTGLVLRIPHRTGMGDVYTKDGKRVELSWDELTKASKNEKAPSPFVPTDPELR